MRFATAITAFALLAAAQGAVIPHQIRQEDKEIKDANAYIASAFADMQANGMMTVSAERKRAPKKGGAGGIASGIVASVADGLGKNSKAGSIVQSVADGLKAGGL